MRPTRIELTNFTAYAQETLDLTTVHLAALTGRNGSGKTSIIEAILWCLYGISTKKTVARDGASECRVAVEFRLGESEYRAVRHRSGSRTLLELFGRAGSEWAAMSAKGVRETEAVIERLLRMDYKSFTSSSMILQGQSANFSAGQTDAERKDTVMKILGLDLWDELLEMTRQRLRHWESTAKGLAYQVAQAQSKLERRSLVEERIRQVDFDLSSAGVRVTEATTAVSNLETQARERPTLEADRSQKRAEIERGLAESERLREQVRQYLAQIADDETQLLRRERLELQIPPAERELAEATAALEAAETALRTAEAEYGRFDSLQAELATLDRQAADRREELTRLEREGAAHRDRLDRAKRVTADAVAIRQAIARASALGADLLQLDAAADLYADLDRQCRDLERQSTVWDQEHNAAVVRLETMLTGLQSQTATLDQVPCGSELRPMCPLLGEALSAMGRQEAYQQQLHGLRQQVNPFRQRWQGLQAERDSLGYDPQQHKVARDALAREREMASKEAMLNESERTVAETEPLIVALQNQYRAAKSALAEIDAQRATVQASLSDSSLFRARLDLAKTTKQTAAQTESGARERLASLRQSLADALETEPVVRRRMETVRKQITEAETRIEDLARLAEELRAKVQLIDVRLQALDRVAEALQAAMATLADERAGERELREALGGLRQELRMLDALEQETTAIRQQIADAEQQVLVHEVMEQACSSKSGVPAFIIENAVPQLERIANELLEQMSAGRFAVQIHTQVEGKSTGRNMDVFRISVLDTGRDRAYEDLSGAEKFMVDLSLRIALSRFLAHRAGAEIKFLVLDEGLGALDGENRLQVMEALQVAAREFEVVLVITHITELQDMLPQRITVIPGDNGSTIYLAA